MRRRKRRFSTFSLAFIDAMACGLGAVVLIFMIINHATEQRATETHRNVADAVSRLETEVLEKRSAAEAMAAALERTEQQLRAAEAQAAQLEAQAATIPEDTEGAADTVARLQQELRDLESRVAELRERAQQSGEATRARVDDGDRQYLTGLKVGGNHILILVDVSASMLDESIVGVIRRRNMSDAARRGAPKWRRAVAAVDWITTQVPQGARFQVYAFNTDVSPALDGTMNQWQSVGDGSRLSDAVAAIRARVPENGTSLHAAFSAASRLSPKPDNIYLVTDGLPTQGRQARSGTVSGQQRLRYYGEAVEVLPRNIPVNILMFPMEGDPQAAGAFWQLAQVSRGAFLTPSKDWP